MLSRTTRSALERGRSLTPRVTRAPRTARTPRGSRSRGTSPGPYRQHATPLYPNTVIPPRPPGLLGGQ